MTSRPYDVTVAYRVYPRVSKAPPLFGDDKLKLAELCLRSFTASAQGLRVRLIALLDGCPPEYGALFRRHFSADDLDIIELSGIGNRMTFSKQIELLSEQAYSELVYFAEDDYFYLPGAMRSMIDFIKSRQGVHFVTPYDHLDYYTSALHRYRSDELRFGGERWRRVGSTCLTFLTSKSALLATRAAFRSYVQTQRSTDYGVWLSLTKLMPSNIVTLVTGFAGRLPVTALLAVAWYYNWRQFLTGKPWKLWAPVPSLATHMDSRFLPPGPDWQAILSKGALQFGLVDAARNVGSTT